MLPACAKYRPSSRRNSVDLPDPLAPSKAIAGPVRARAKRRRARPRCRNARRHRHSNTVIGPSNRPRSASVTKPPSQHQSAGFARKSSHHINLAAKAARLHREVYFAAQVAGSCSAARPPPPPQRRRPLAREHLRFGSCAIRTCRAPSPESRKYSDTSFPESTTNTAGHRKVRSDFNTHGHGVVSTRIADSVAAVSARETRKAALRRPCCVIVRMPLDATAAPGSQEQSRRGDGPGEEQNRKPDPAGQTPRGESREAMARSTAAANNEPMARVRGEAETTTTSANNTRHFHPRIHLLQSAAEDARSSAHARHNPTRTSGWQACAR